MDAHTKIMNRSVLLWGGTGLVMSFNLFAALQKDPALTYAALALTGAMALAGIAFGVWTGLTIARARSAPR